MPDALAILAEVLGSYSDHPKWTGSPFENIRRVPNTKVGDVGQDFVEKLCLQIGFSVAFPEDAKGKRKRQSPWDMMIEGKTFEVKTASEDKGGAFQFNHVRYHRPYEAVLCIGIGPGSIFMGAWTKADIVTGKVGTLVSMEQGANASYKMSKRPDQLRPITDFEDAILDLLAALDG